MDKVIAINKPLGLSPLEAIYLFKKQFPMYTKIKISYAGRLDPMAEGVLLLLIGEENKQRNIYENLEKCYQFQFLSNIETDTYDTLGVVQKRSFTIERRFSESELKKLIQKYISLLKSKTTQTYPPYSSRTVHGKPLYYWARNNLLATITIPKRDIHISSLRIDSTSSFSSTLIKEQIIQRIHMVKGDFRQKDILDTWQKYFASTRQQMFSLASLSITCSSGTYIRSLCHELGEYIGYGGIAYSIKRTRVGTYSLRKSIFLE